MRESRRRGGHRYRRVPEGLLQGYWSQAKLAGWPGAQKVLKRDHVEHHRILPSLRTDTFDRNIPGQAYYLALIPIRGSRMVRSST